MAGTSTKTEVITLRVPIALAADWRGAAKRRGETVSAYIIREMTPPAPIVVRGIHAAGKQVLSALRSDPANRIIDPDLTQSVGHPVLKSAVPTTVAGNVGWCGLKGQDKAKGKKS